MNGFHDGVYSEARRTYVPSGRSWHIPEPVSEYRRPTFVLVVAAFVVVIALVVGVVS